MHRASAQLTGICSLSLHFRASRRENEISWITDSIKSFRSLKRCFFSSLVLSFISFDRVQKRVYASTKKKFKNCLQFQGPGNCQVDPQHFVASIFHSLDIWTEAVKKNLCKWIRRMIAWWCIWIVKIEVLLAHLENGLELLTRIRLDFNLNSALQLLGCSKLANFRLTLRYSEKQSRKAF